MLSPELLEILRCPLNPGQARLRHVGDKLHCEQCDLRFHVKDGFPILVVEEAELPPGCSAVAQLPCQRPSGTAAP
jgi:uncharacterized protein